MIKLLQISIGISTLVFPAAKEKPNTCAPQTDDL